MGFSDIGNQAALYIQEIPEKRANMILDEFIVMPNHIHCILEITKSAGKKIMNSNKYGVAVPNSISIIINQFKGKVKKWCDKNGHAEFEWHGRFHDHVIRDWTSHQMIRDYIINNPGNWDKDRYR